MAEIKFIAGVMSGETLALPEEKTLRMGRSTEVELTIPDPVVSGSHAQLSCKDGIWTIRDLDSANGTTVNGTNIMTRALKSGDKVAVGETTFVFVGEKAAEGAAAVAQPEPEPAEKPPSSLPRAPRPEQVAKATPEDVERVRKMRKITSAIRDEVGKVIVGQREVVDQVLMCLVAGGHGLLIGLPGMAKTLLVRTLATVLHLKFKRVQFTPDLMPTDIIGTDVLETNRDTGEKEFRFLKGPIFCNLLLADEINRTPPKTQAALLEAMQEHDVTAGNVTYHLDEPFFVLATQNPIEQEGTYPLPEAQLDRFMFNIWVDYPEEHEEEEIVGTTTSGAVIEPDAIMTKEDILQLQEVVRKIPVSEHIIKYVIRLVRATRPGNEHAPEITKKYVSTGAGPRAGQYLVLAAKSMAILDGRIHVSCNDIRRAAPPVLRHRILTNFAADSEGLTSMSIIEKLIEELPEPGEEDYSPDIADSRAGKKDRGKPLAALKRATASVRK